MPALRINLVLHFSKYGSKIQVHSILYYGHMTSDLHRLLQECSWGIKQGLGIVTCNTEESVAIGLVCVFLEVFLTALYFRVT